VTIRTLSGQPTSKWGFWINGDGTFPVSKDVYYMNGVGGQRTVIIPSHELVVVRLGHFKGEALAIEAFETRVLVGRHPEDPARLKSASVPAEIVTKFMQG